MKEAVIFHRKSVTVNHWSCILSNSSSHLLSYHMAPHTVLKDNHFIVGWLFNQIHLILFCKTLPCKKTPTLQYIFSLEENINKT